MSPEERDLLYKTHELAEENNKILRSLRSVQRWDRVIKYGYWIVIIGLSFGSYYLIQPYIDQVKPLLSGSEQTIQQLQSFMPR